MIILILIAIYLISAVCLLYKFVEKNIDSVTSVLFIVCPILNTILIISYWIKENKAREIKKEVKEILNSLK